MCDGNVLRDHHAVQCDRCDKWLHTRCCNIDDSTYVSLMSSNCNWVCPLCDTLNFSDSFFSEGDISNDNPFDVFDLDQDANEVDSSVAENNLTSKNHRSLPKNQIKHNKRKVGLKKTKPKSRGKVKIVVSAAGVLNQKQRTSLC